MILSLLDEMLAERLLPEPAAQRVVSLSHRACMAATPGPSGSGLYSHSIGSSLPMDALAGIAPSAKSEPRSGTIPRFLPNGTTLCGEKEAPPDNAVHGHGWAMQMRSAL